ncbi:EamA family transporter [Falsiroseomonas sp. HW251]|uniref:EamA family transporter n=1 Tax=Falsiroseomonas sp. HW251 TaxID=3390998 RepID=UPI003D3166C7
MTAWIAYTLAAALFQCWRTALQQRLRGELSVNAAAVVRYLYGVPVGLALLLAYGIATGDTMPSMSAWIVLLCALAGLGQIIGTNLLIMAFGHRNFAVGTAYSKTEAMQAAIIAVVFLGEHLSTLSWLGIAVGVGGVLYLSLAGRGLTAKELLKGITQPAALCGIGAGLGFAVTAILVRQANQAMPPGDLIHKALLILVVTNALQTLMQGGWLAWAEPQSVRQVFSTWRSSSRVGALSALGSACWFSAFALAPVALVRALGQVEILFTLAFSRFYLREKARPADMIGALVVVAGVVLVLIGSH